MTHGAWAAATASARPTRPVWNLPVLLLMAGATAQFAMLGSMTLPEPSSVLWWLTRPSWLALSVLLTLGVGVLLGGIERRTPAAVTAGPREALQGVALGVSAVLLLLLAGTSPLTAVGAILLMLLALRRAGGKGVLGPAPVRRPLAPTAPLVSDGATA